MDKKLKILVVDDEPEIRDLFKMLLEEDGHVVQVAENGKIGVDLFKTSFFDVVLLDVHMPVMTGPVALTEIKKHKPSQKVVIFSSSSDPDLKFEKEAEKLGAFTCLFKPVSIEEILSILEKATK
ncbi:MAG: hypothetical protein A2231_08765 [Candidatus Firestonebacteria bacterium RIFOXYA2_FULL_40_8]|nr:MAG: hypothetical protein A2231_08765 [Candidatus Firestonebacteria bacterium RIFOXYA2_FULL_40_8]